MNAHEFLFRPTVLRKRVQNTTQRILSLTSLAQQVTIAFGPQSEPVSHTRNTTAMQDAAIRLMEAKEILAQQERDLALAELEVGLVMDRIEDEDIRELMQKKFLEGMTVREIVEPKGLSEAWGRKKLQKGFEILQRILDEDGIPEGDPCGEKRL